MARPPKPTAKLKQTGTYRKDRHETRLEFKPIEYFLDCPETIKGQKAKDAWNRIVKNLCEQKLISENDFEILEDAFINYDIANSLMEQINAMGGPVEYLKTYSVKDGKKDLLKDWKSYNDKFETLLFKFGCTPVENAKIKGIQTPPSEEEIGVSVIKGLIENGG